MTIVRSIMYSLYVYAISRVAYITFTLLLLSSLLPLLGSSSVCWGEVVGVSQVYSVNPTSLYWLLALLVGYKMFSDEKDSNMLLLVYSKPVSRVSVVLGKVLAGYLLLLSSYMVVSLVSVMVSVGSCSLSLSQIVLYPFAVSLLSMPLLLTTSIGGLLRGSGFSLQVSVASYIFSKILNIVAVSRQLVSETSKIISENITSLKDIIGASLSLMVKAEVVNPYTNAVPLVQILFNGSTIGGLRIDVPGQYVTCGLLLNIVLSLILVSAHVIYSVRT